MSVPPFPDFSGVTRVVVTGNGGRDTLGIITDSADIAVLVSFVNAQNSDWDQPWYGVPVPQIRAGFWNGSDFQGSFGAGPNFFETQRAGTFASREAMNAELDRFAALVGVTRAQIQDSRR